MKKNTIKLKELMFEILHKNSDWAGTPLAVVAKLMGEKASFLGIEPDSQLIHEVIQTSLDLWEIEKTLSYIPKERAMKLDLTSEYPVWHLKILSKQQQEWYRQLDDIDKAVIKLLREQNEPDSLGQMLIVEGKKKLVEQGFDVGWISFHVEDKVRKYFSTANGVEVEWFGIIDEYEKTEEYKREQRERALRYERKQLLLSQLDDEDMGEEEESP